MSDERYDRSADMRLLERQRESLGIPAHVIHPTPDADPALLMEAERGDDDEPDDEVYVHSGTVLIATIDARPREALVPGALVTVSLSVTNDGDVAARELRLSLALPLDTAYRPGTLSIDMQTGSDEIAQALFENGAELENIGPGSRRTLTLQLLIEAGTSDVILTPHLCAASGAVLGLRAMRLTRRMPTVRGLAERPFYESDDAEHEVEPLEPIAPRPIIAVLQPREYPPAIIAEPSPATPRVESATAPGTISPEAAPRATLAATVSAPVQKSVVSPIAQAVPEAVTVTAPNVATVTVPKVATASVPKVAAVTVPVLRTPIVTAPVVNAIASPSPNRAEMVARIVAEARAKHSAEALKTAGGVITAPKRPMPSTAESVAEVIDSRTLHPVAKTEKLKAKSLVRPTIEVVRSTDDPFTSTGNGAPAISPRSDELRLSDAPAFFKGPSLDLIVDYLVLNALAARDPAASDAMDGTTAAIAASQEQLLSRALFAMHAAHRERAASDVAPRPGVLATVSYALAKVGADASSRKVCSRLTLPVEAIYRPGAIPIDTREGSESDAQTRFANGAKLELSIEAGPTDVLLTPRLTAPSGAVLGLRATRLENPRPISSVKRTRRPFAKSATAKPLSKVVKSRTSRSVIKRGAVAAKKRAPKPTEVIGPGVVVVQSTDDRLAFAGQGGPTLSVRIDRRRRSTLKVYLCVAVPVDAAYGPGALSIDTQLAGGGAEQPFFANGTALEDIGLDHALTLRLRTRAGTNDVMLTPTLNAGSGAAQGLTATRSTRRVPTVRGVVEPAEKKRATPPKAKTARRKIEVVRSSDDTFTTTGKGGPMLSVGIDRRRLATLTGFFKGPSLGMIAHYLVLNALAAREPLAGDGTDGAIAAFVASQEQLLSRALIAMRLGKTPASQSVAAALPAFPPALATHAEPRAVDSPPPGETTLFRAFKPAEVRSLKRMLANHKAPAFMRAAKLFVGLCANDAVVLDAHQRQDLGLALTAYAAQATAEIDRLFLSAKSNREPELFKATDSDFDDAAKSVLAAIARSIA